MLLYSIQTVRDLETLVQRSRNKPFDSFEEAEIAMEILEDVTGIVHLMSVGDNIMPRFASMSVSNLDLYMGIMDYTIGKPAEKMWSKVRYYVFCTVFLLYCKFVIILV